MNRLVVLLICLPLAVSSQDGYVIDGNVHLSDDWEPVVYLSVLESLDDLTMVSGDMIIDHALIDSSGSFHMQSEYLPEGERLYRLHVSKRGDPASTIVIGGRDENHVHFAIAPGDIVRVSHPDSARVFAGLTVESNHSNDCISQVNALVRDLRVGSATSAAQAKLRDGEASQALLSLAQACEHALGKLYAAHHILERYESPETVMALMALHKSGDVAATPYFDAFDKRLQVAALHYDLVRSRAIGAWAWLIVPLLIGAIWYWYFMRRRRQPEQAVLALSVQERKVLELLVDGRSNKEISSELNIGVSTVKSHVHRIYGKLGIQSRREAIRFKQFFN